MPGGRYSCNAFCIELTYTVDVINNGIQDLFLSTSECILFSSPPVFLLKSIDE